jgi:hypothetical protein
MREAGQVRLPITWRAIESVHRQPQSRPVSILAVELGWLVTRVRGRPTVAACLMHEDDGESGSSPNPNPHTHHKDGSCSAGKGKTALLRLTEYHAQMVALAVALAARDDTKLCIVRGGLQPGFACNGDDVPECDIVDELLQHGMNVHAWLPPSSKEQLELCLTTSHGATHVARCSWLK